MSKGSVTWSEAMVSRPQRWTSLGARGGTVWLTGLSGSGKSSIAKHMEADLLQEGVAAYVLDGDNLRHGLCADLGFSKEDRSENCRRAARVAGLMADAGMVAIVALISPYVEDRHQARQIHEAEGLPFLEVWVSTPAKVCEARDPKGLYAGARSGGISQFTHVSDPYEVPAHPDVALSTAERSVDDAAHEVLNLVRERILGHGER